MKTWCVYLTMYSGDKLPKWYIGSSYEEKVLKGYNGSVCSKEYRETYINEQKENKHLFKTRILSKHIDSISARAEELRLQKMHNVVKNKKYINKSLASVNGYFGMEKSASDKLLISVNNSNKVVAKDLTTNKIIKVSKEEFDSNKNLVSISLNKVVCRNINTNIVSHISKDVFDDSDCWVGVRYRTVNENWKDTIMVLEDGIYKRKSKTELVDTDKMMFRDIIVVKDINNNYITVDKRNVPADCTYLRTGIKHTKETCMKISKKRIELKLAAGSNNGNAKNYIIYDENRNLICESFGNLKEVSSMIGIPFASIRKALSLNGIIYDGAKKNDITRLEKSGNIRFKNWYIEKC